MLRSRCYKPEPAPEQALCHAVCVAAIVFDVVAKVCTLATNFLNFCMADSDLALGAAGFEFATSVGCGAGEGRICTWSAEGATGSGLFLSWTVALGSKSMGFG